MVRKGCLFTRVKISLELQQGPSACEQQIEVHWISDITQCPRLGAEAQIVTFKVSGCLQDDRNKPCLRIAADSPRQFITADLWHDDVCDNQIWLIRLNRRKRLCTVGRGADFITLHP